MHKSLQAAFVDRSWAVPTRNIPRSGPGSTLEHTAGVRRALPKLFERYNVKTFVDAPCGDWHWMQHVPLDGVTYIGLDIVPDLVATNTRNFGAPNIRFDVADVTSDPLPKADMLMCRDCLFHLKFWLRWAFFETFAASGTPYLLTTMHSVSTNRNIPRNGGFRRFNPKLAPFNLGDPIEMFDDTPRVLDEGHDSTSPAERYMGLWHRDQVVAALARRDTE